MIGERQAHPVNGYVVGGQEGADRDLLLAEVRAGAESGGVPELRCEGEQQYGRLAEGSRGIEGETAPVHAEVGETPGANCQLLRPQVHRVHISARTESNISSFLAGLIQTVEASLHQRGPLAGSCGATRPGPVGPRITVMRRANAPLRTSTTGSSRWCGAGASDG